MNSAGCLMSIPAISLTPSARLVLVGNPRGQRETEAAPTLRRFCPGSVGGDPSCHLPPPAAVGCAATAVCINQCVGV